VASACRTRDPQHEEGEPRRWPQAQSDYDFRLDLILDGLKQMAGG